MGENNMKKKIRKLVFIIVIALTIIITGGVVAYLTDTDNATNTFTVGSVSIDLTEDNWDEINGQNVTPGKVIAKDPAIKNTGKNSAYVYLKVYVPLVKHGTDKYEPNCLPLVTYVPNGDWTMIDSESSPAPCSGTPTKVFAYKNALDSGETTTTLFDNVTVPSYEESSASGSYNVIVTAYAIQSDGLPSGTTIESAYNTYFKN
jgi:predicted ribosomally synthesized peptide with SipW-like signal peptide